MTNIDESIIREFLEKMSTQDNRATAFPIYFVIRTAKWIVVPDGCGDEMRYYDTECHEYYIGQDEYDALPDTGAAPNEDGITKENYEGFELKKTWEESGMFLTETDADQHLKANKHHYSEDAHTYVKHAWRAPELTEFLLALFRTYNIPPRKDPGTI